MQQEQRIILRMLEEGKITAEEAEALLNALGDGPGPSQSEPQEDPWARLEKLGEDFASRVEVATERFSRSLEHKTEGLGDKLNRLPKILARFPFLGHEESQEFTRVVRGDVGESELIPIELSNSNGLIRVQGWSEDYYQLTVVQRLQGRDRELLRSRLFDLDWVDGAKRDDFFLAVPASRGEGSVALHLMIPEKYAYQVKLSSQNGSLRVENLKCSTITLDTTNGSTVLRSIRCDTVEGQVGNGSCEMEGVEAKLIRHRLGNGSYRLSVSARDVDCITTNGSVSLRVAEVHEDSSYRLLTTNGSINVSLPPPGNVGVSLNLQTSVGRVSTSLGGLETIKQERMGGGALLVARSTGFTEKSPNVVLEASSTSGSITVGLSGAGE